MTDVVGGACRQQTADVVGPAARTTVCSAPPYHCTTACPPASVANLARLDREQTRGLLMAVSALRPTMFATLTSACGGRGGKLRTG